MEDFASPWSTSWNTVGIVGIVSYRRVLDCATASPFDTIEREMPMTPEHVDILVLGSGEGGKYFAWHMGHAGHRVAVVERRWIGGSCPNINCLPSKNEIWGAEVASLVRRAPTFGTMTTPIAVDMAVVRQRKRDMVESLIAMHRDKYKMSGAELIMGTGRFVGAKTLDVRLNDGGSRVLLGDRVFLNVGTHATIPDIPGLAAAGPLTHIEALELDRLPEHLIVLGGGYVGLEFGQAYRRFGSRVPSSSGGPSSSRAKMRTSPTPSAEFWVTKESTSFSGPMSTAWRGAREKVFAFASVRLEASTRSMAAIF